MAWTGSSSPKKKTYMVSLACYPNVSTEKWEVFRRRSESFCSDSLKYTEKSYCFRNVGDEDWLPRRYNSHTQPSLVHINRGTHIWYPRTQWLKTRKTPILFYKWVAKMTCSDDDIMKHQIGCLFSRSLLTIGGIFQDPLCISKAADSTSPTTITHIHMYIYTYILQITPNQ